MLTRLDLTNVYINKNLKIYGFFILVNYKNENYSYLVEVETNDEIDGKHLYKVPYETKEEANIFINRLLEEYGYKKSLDDLVTSTMEMYKAVFKYEGDWIKREALLTPEVGD